MDRFIIGPEDRKLLGLEEPELESNIGLLEAIGITFIRSREVNLVNTVEDLRNLKPEEDT